MDDRKGNPDCIHCILHDTYDAWYEKHKDEGVEVYEVGYLISQFANEVLMEIPQEMRVGFIMGMQAASQAIVEASKEEAKASRH